MANLAAQMIEGGQPQGAEALASTLVQRDAKDAQAWLLLATARMAQQDFDGGLDAARKAFRSATTPSVKVRAARMAAAANFQSQRFFRAEYWLRQARQHVTTPDGLRAVQADFQGLKRANPWEVSVSAAIAPNSNINNGSDQETIIIWGLPFRLNADARPLSGLEYSAGVNLARRISESATHQTKIGLNTFYRTFSMSADAKAKAPDVSGGDYAFGVAELFWQRNWQHKLANGPASLNATFGKNWYAGEAYTRYGRLSFGQEFRNADGSSLSANLSVQRLINDRDNGMLSTTWTLGAQHSLRLASGDILLANAGWDKTTSTHASLRNTAIKAGLTYALAKPIVGSNLSLSAGVEKRDWKNSTYEPTPGEGRHDKTVNVGANLVLNQMSAYGFTPALRFDARKTFSNISLFSKTSYGVRLGLESRF